jgi:hypothetical protein
MIMKHDIKNVMQKAGLLFDTQVKKKVSRIVKTVKYELLDQPDKKERNRKIILVFASLFFLDYLMYCLHTNSAIFGIFPTLPTLDEQKEVTVYLPALDGSTIIREKRSIPVYESDEKTAKELFEIVVRGSMYENTALAVPVDLFVTKVWLHRKGAGRNSICVFDLEPVELSETVPVIANSESLFKKALEITITKNIPAVKEILILEKGIPLVRLWEL